VTSLEETANISDKKGKGVESEAVAMDKRHLSAKASITDIATKVENDKGESIRKLSQPMACQINRFMPLFTRAYSSQKSQPGE
jgi:hypothetical protein